MGNWQERMRQARSAEQQQLRARQDAERLRAQQEEDRKLGVDKLRNVEEAAVKERTGKDLPPLLEHFRARKLLQEICDDVWQRQGRVDAKEISLIRIPFSGPSAWYVKLPIVLHYDYPIAVEHQKTLISSHISAGGYSVGGVYDQAWTIGEKQTSLTIEAVYDPRERRGKESFLRVKDSEVEVHHPINEANAYGTIWNIFQEDPDAHGKLGQLLLRSCLQRTRGRGEKLPLNLKAEGERKIARVIPIYRRLFR